MIPNRLMVVMFFCFVSFFCDYLGCCCIWVAGFLEGIIEKLKTITYFGTMYQTVNVNIVMYMFDCL